MSDDSFEVTPQDEEMIGTKAELKGPKRAEEIILVSKKNDQNYVNLTKMDLQELGFMQSHIWANLYEVNVSRNMITNIDVLTYFPNLRVIDAQNNYIQEVNLYLPQLTSLNLSHNYLTNFPLLENMNKLRYLNCNYNQIVSFQEVEIDFTPNIQTLELQGNQIWFDSPMDFESFVLMLQKLQSLKSLNVDENPFFLPENLKIFTGINVKENLTRRLKKLQYFNSDDMDSVQQQMEKEKIYENIQATNSFSSTATAEPTKVSKKKSKPPPDLNTLLDNLEKANSHPSRALDHLKNLALNADEIVLKINIVEQNFAPDQDDSQVQENIVTFMQNTQLLIDNHYELQSIMLSILAKLSMVRFQNFGLYCFNTLKDLMKSGRHMQNQVVEVLKNEIISKKLNHEDPHMIPVTLLAGLYELIKDTEMSSMLDGLFENSFPAWIQKYVMMLEKSQAQNNLIGNDKHYDSIICLLSVSFKENGDNIDKFHEKKMADGVTRIIKLSFWEHDRYIPILHVIANVSNNSEELATIFMENLVHKILMAQIKKSMNMYKKSHSLFDEMSQETVYIQMLKYQTLAAEIIALGGLLKSPKRMEILEDLVILDLVAVMSHPMTDPILLTAICTFALDLFECDELRYNQDFMEPFHKNLSDMKYLIPYLGFENYLVIIESSKRYHMATNPMHKIVENIDFFEFGASNQNEPEYKDTEEQKIQKSLIHLDDQIVKDLCVSIIKLIRYFCSEAEGNKGNSLFDATSASLNSNRRETALFNCLEIPDDAVRLAVVECLLVVPLDEYDMDEINRVIKVISGCNNIGAGQTEVIISVIYWILTKMVQSDPNELESSNIFQNKFGDMATTEALQILQRNLLRDVDDDDEDIEKYTLSLSILNFLKSATHAPIMMKYLRNRKKLFKKILLNEERFSSERIKKIPIDIENSLIGRDMPCLIETIVGVDSLSPFTDTSLRVLMRIGDVLMYRHYCYSYDLQDTAKVQEGLFQRQEKIYLKKKKQEMDYWVDMPSCFIDDLQGPELKELDKQHQNFSGSSCVDILTQFLTTKYQINDDYLKFLCDPCFKEIPEEGEPDPCQYNLEDEIRKKKNLLESKFRNQYIGKDNPMLLRQTMYLKWKMRNQDSNTTVDQQSKKGENEDASESNNTKIITEEEMKNTNYYKYRKNMNYKVPAQDFSTNSIVTGSDESNTYSNRLNNLQIKHNQEQQEKANDFNSGGLSIQDKRGDGFLNDNLRSLTIAAYLRCLYGAIEYAPDYAYKLNTINTLRDPEKFRTVTQLCDSTNWDENANIGAKYLRLMRHILKLDTEKDVETIDMLMHYQLLAVVIQKALQKIVVKMDKNITLTNGDQVTIYEICLTFFTLIQQSQNFVFSQMEIVKQFWMNEHRLNSRKNHDTQPYQSQGSCTTNRDELKILLMEKESDQPPWKLKCEYSEQEKEVSVHNFKIDMITLRNKRTIQSKIVEFMLLKIFSKQSIFSLVDIIFKDMKEDYQNIELASSDEEEEEEEAKQNQQKEHESDAESDGAESVDPTKYQVDIDEYMSLKGVLTIERIKDIIGEIMNTCTKTMRYEILKKIMGGVIFDQKRLRDSFMQEILTAADDAIYRQAMQNYINQKQLTVHYYFKDPQPEVRFERIINQSMVDINNVVFQGEDKNGLFTQRIFLLTNHGIQIMRNIPTKEMCKRCSRHQFCPRGPFQEYCIKFDSIKSIINFAQVPQKLVIIYEIAENARFQMTLHFPTFTKTAKVYQNLQDILQGLDLEEDNDLDILDHTERSQKDIGKSSRRSLKAESQAALTSRARTKGEGDVTCLTTHHVDHSLSTSNDLFFQYEFKQVVKQIDPAASKSDIKSIKLIYASLKSTTLVSSSFFKEQIVDKVGGSITVQDKAKQTTSKLFSFIDKTPKPSTEDEGLNIKNRVLIGISGSKMFFLKEKWQNWIYIPEQKQIVEVKKHHRKKAASMTPEEPIEPPGEEAKEDITGAMEKYCEMIKSDLFKVVTCINFSPTEKKDIDVVKIHRGKDPSIEIECFGEMHNMQILFTGDMERQRFIEAVLPTDEGDDEEESMHHAQHKDNEKNHGENSDSEDADEVEDECSFESILDAIIYN